MEKIHSTAIIDPAAELAENVKVGPYSIIGPNVKIKEGCIIEAHVVLDGNTEIGKNCVIASSAVIGTPPQDVSYKGEPTHVVIGDNTTIREFATINRASGEGMKTVIGSNCMIMAYSHVAHNCIVGDNVNMANNASLAGHVEVENNCFLGGTTVYHQFVKVGKYAIVSGFSGTRQDIPPFSIADGRPAIIRGVNKVGLRRNNFSRTEIDNLRKAFKIIWFEKSNLTQALEKVETEVETDENIKYLVDFIKNSKRRVNTKRESDSFI